MRRTRDWGIRKRLTLAFLGVLVPYVGLAALGAVGFHSLWQRVHAFQHEAVTELGAAADLQLTVAQLVMPANDYLITGDPRERDEFERRLMRVRQALMRARLASFDDPEEQRLLDTVRVQVSEMEAVSHALLALPDPVGNRAAVAKMKALARLSDDVARSLNRIHEITRREIEEDTHKISRMIRWVAIAGLAMVILSIAGGVVIALILSIWITGPIRAIADGSRRMAEGDLSQRVEVSAGGELGESARAFNEMAARLEAFTRENARLYEDALAQRARLAQIFDSTSDGLMLVRPDGRIESANRRAAEIFRFDPAGAGEYDLAAALARLNGALSASDRVAGALRSQLADPEQSGHGDLELIAPSRRVLHWVGQPTRDAAGATVGLTLSFRDVTREREVDRMKSDFVSLVTHQLRTPLAGIKWLLELTAGEPGLSEDIRSYVQDARESADRLVGLVNDLLDVARLEQGRLKIDAQETDLGALTRSVVDEVRLLAGEKGHRLSIAGADEIPAVVVDPMLLRQVVTNLLSNAIKYSPPNGSIAIRMRYDDGAVAWAIQDSGIGVPKAEQGRLFEKFFRAENAATTVTDGTGLGLYLVRLIVERFGGRVWCESEECQGARFTFTLPLAGKTS